MRRKIGLNVIKVSRFKGRNVLALLGGKEGIVVREGLVLKTGRVVVGAVLRRLASRWSNAGNGIRLK
jgi:hypothetical protein